MKTTKQLRSFAARMRKYPTRGEIQAALILSNLNLRYLNQVPFGFYILDFVVPSKLLVIEIDGSSHDNKVDYDKQRDLFIQSFGLQVVHVKNEDVNTILHPLIQTFSDFKKSSELWKMAVCKASEVRKKANLQPYTKKRKKRCSKIRKNQRK